MHITVRRLPQPEASPCEHTFRSHNNNFHRARLRLQIMYSSSKGRATPTHSGSQNISFFGMINHISCCPASARLNLWLHSGTPSWYSKIHFEIVSHLKPLTHGNIFFYHRSGTATFIGFVLFQGHL